MAKQQTNANWLTLDVDTLPKASQDAYASYKDAYTDMKAARTEFEDGLRKAFASKTPKGKRVVFGYNFGKLSIALVDDVPAKSAPKGALDFATLLA